ncbi:MAG: vgr related protein [Novosphingobium sp. 28-62-57]|nr:MAG: vgr related protein [Novosphingobium sp. 12-62-10]OYZ12732.1 MAG: vgr related protein [Novosphingobium sp. 28-62-57]OYZ99145.1 MAG: vgr related protein [Novosphingobium sp. 17-62-8]
MGGERPLTRGERALVTEVFGTSIDTGPVRLRRRRWFPFQPTNVVMAPMGHLHFAPASPHWCDDFSCASLGGQGLFIHEMVHVWQTQLHGKWWLPLMRHPFCRYSYTYRKGRPFERYGIEQQAELVRHLFMARRGSPHPDAPPLPVLEALMPFGNA